MEAEPSTHAEAPPLIELENISRRFGSLWANRDISLKILEGEIHALLGENGAGKSTLMKILYGHIQPDSGRIYIRGKPAILSHPLEALKAGIGMVHQQLLIFPQLTALENIIVGSEPRKGFWIRRKKAAEKLGGLCRLFGFDLSLDKAAGELSFAQRQQIELLRVLFRGARILVLDEPTSLLAPPEVERFIQFLGSLKESGHTILFISHRLGEVFSLADRISILSRGRCLGTFRAKETSPEEIARAIATGKLTSGSPDRGEEERNEEIPFRPEEEIREGPFLELRNVSTKSTASEAGLFDLSLLVAKGEILGLGGVVGNGERSLARVLSGFEPVASGAIFLDGRDITGCSIGMRAEAGLRWLPANPREEALMTNASIAENLILGRQREPFCQSQGRLDREGIERWVSRQLEEGEVAFSSMEERLSALSGGNQQKIALARVLEGNPRLVVLEQPGRGLDIRAQERLHQRIRSLNSKGATFVVLSHDLDELLSLSHRVGILYRGKIMGMVERSKASREILGKWMLGLGGD